MKKIKKAQAGLSTAAKRVGPVDPMGAWTKVQEMNLPPRNVKSSASLTKNKMQGATTMAKKGAKIGRSEKQMGLDKKSVSMKEINPALFRKAQLKREGEVMNKQSGEQAPMAKGGKWIQKVTKSIKKRGTEGVCTGSKFGGPTCKPGSRRYNLAKTFRAMAKKKK